MHPRTHRARGSNSNPKAGRRTPADGLRVALTCAVAVAVSMGAQPASASAAQPSRLPTGLELSTAAPSTGHEAAQSILAPSPAASPPPINRSEAAIPSSPAARTDTPNRTGTLDVHVSGLPSTVAAHIVVSGPDHVRLLVKHTTVLRRLRPGRYRLRVQQVSIQRSMPSIPAGSVAYPTRTSTEIIIHAGHRASTSIVYGTIRSARTHVLTITPSGLAGDPSDPSAITLPRQDGLAVGSIIATAPSTRLPAGLFDRVTSATPHGTSVTLSLTAATLEEAFPAIDVQTSVSFNVGSPPASASSAHTASALSDIDLAFSDTLIADKLQGSCGAPPTGWSFSPHGTVHPTLNVNLHKGAFSLLYGELDLTLTGDAGFQATLPAAVHCDLTVPGPSADTVIPIAGVPVPVEGSIDLDVSLSLTGAAHVQTDAQLSITGGVDMHGVYGTPILRIVPKASGSVQIAGGKISMGPEMQVGLGLSDINGHVDDSLNLAAKGSSSGSCEIDIGGSAGIGLDLWSLHPSFTPFSPEVPVYHCPAPGGSGSGTGSSPGGSESGSGAGAGGASTGESGSTGGGEANSAPSRIEADGPTSGPAGLKIPFTAPPCIAETGDRAYLVYTLEGTYEARGETEIVNGAYPSLVQALLDTRDVPVGTHELIVTCESRSSISRRTVWEERAFPVDTTEATRSVQLSSTTAEPGETIGVISAAPAGKSPCPIVDSTPWTNAYVSLLVDLELVGTEFYSMQQATTEMLDEYHFTIPTYLKSGTDALVYVHCQTEIPTNKFPVEFEYYPVPLQIGA